MTILVGILCKDGVVIGADSAATFAAGQMRTIEQETKKIDIVEGRIIVASTGAIGLAQRFTAVVEQGWKSKVFTKSALDVGKALSSDMIKDFASTHLKVGNFGALAAFCCQQKPYLVEFGVNDFQPELKTPNLWYVSMGSGQMIADPFLGLMRQAFWDDGIPSCKDAEFVVTWILSMAIKLNPGGVNAPMHVAVLESDQGNFTARLLDQAELDGHEDNVAGLIEHMRKYKEIVRGNDLQGAPDIPKPDAPVAKAAERPQVEASESSAARAR